MPRLRFKSYDELNGWLLDKCLSWAKAHAHPERRDGRPAHGDRAGPFHPSSTIWPKSSCAGAVSGRPSSDWRHLKLRGTFATPMMVHKHVMRSSSARPSLRSKRSAPSAHANPHHARRAPHGAWREAQAIGSGRRRDKGECARRLRIAKEEPARSLDVRVAGRETLAARPLPGSYSIASPVISTETAAPLGNLPTNSVAGPR